MILYYTHNRLDEKIADLCRRQLSSVGLPIVSCSLKPIDFGRNVALDLEPSPTTMFKQILTGLELCDDYVFLAEHDVLYHPSHFNFKPKEDKFYFNTNVWKWKWGSELIVWTDDLQQLSGMSGYRETLVKFFTERLAKAEAGFDRHYEPRRNTENYRSDLPNIDIRHSQNMTRSKWSPDEFRNKKYSKGWTESTINNLWFKI